MYTHVYPAVNGEESWYDMTQKEVLLKKIPSTFSA